MTKDQGYIPVGVENFPFGSVSNPALMPTLPPNQGH